MHDEVIYRCIHAACARTLPRRVNYCPWCGTSQLAGVPKPEEILAPAQVSMIKPVAPAPAPPATPPPPAAPAPRPAVPAAPPQRRPVRLRYWLLALAVLWAIWITQRPDTKKIDTRIDSAIAMATACRSGEAQSELIALRQTRATPEQLQRLQAALNDADAACERKRRRSKSARPLARQQAQSARNLVAEAQREMARGDYKAASNKMEVCASMVDPDNRECKALKARVDRLQGEMQRCLSGGQEWIGDRCQ